MIVSSSKSNSNVSSSSITGGGGGESNMQEIGPQLPMLIENSIEWTCSGCTFVNPIAIIKCSVCDTAKPGGSNNESKIAESKSGGISTAIVPATWNCEVCTCLNDNSKSACQACDTPKPTTVGQETKKSGPASDAEWSCGTCTFKNAGALKKCTICGSAKEETSSESKVAGKYIYIAVRETQLLHRTKRFPLLSLNSQLLLHPHPRSVLLHPYPRSCSNIMLGLG